MKIELLVISITISLTLFALNATSVNWDSPETQTVDQMLNDNGLAPADVQIVHRKPSNILASLKRKYRRL